METDKTPAAGTAAEEVPRSDNRAETQPAANDGGHSDARLSDSPESLAATSSLPSTLGSTPSSTPSLDKSVSTSGRFLHLPFSLPTKDDIINVKAEMKNVKEDIVAAIPSKEELEKEVRKYYSDPINVAALTWYVVAIPALIIMCLRSVGLLAVLIPNDKARHDCEEVALQLMNALFLLATLALFPLMARHTYILIRWLPRDRVELRHFYCRNGKRKPKDRTHIAIVVMWGHLTAWSVLATCIYYWATLKKERSYTVMMFLSFFSTAMSAGGILHLLLSPLSQEFDIVKDGDDEMVKMFERRYSFYAQGQVVKEPVWDGSLLRDCCKDWRVACCTALCSVCVFGSNLERLGFGNGVVHVLSFLVILLGPALIFELIISMVPLGATAKAVLAGCGLFLSLLGIAYGGLWRAKIRRRFRLPGTRLCCKSKTMTDICIWTWCCWCAVCQETRTINFYSIGVNREMDSSSRGEQNQEEEDYEALPAALEEADEGDWTYAASEKGNGGSEEKVSKSREPASKEAPPAERMSQ